MQRTNWEKEMLHAMAENLTGQGIETKFDKGDGITSPDMLKAKFAVLGDDDGIVICEMCFLEFQQEPPVMQVFTTIAVNLSHKGVTELEKAVARLNLYCPVGAFGLFYENNQLFHKYTIVMDDSNQAIQAVDQCEKVLEMILGIIGSQYNMLINIADGNITCADAIEQGLMQA